MAVAPQGSGTADGTGATERLLASHREQVEELQAELAETNSGVIALSLELAQYHQHLEDLVQERTAQLQSAQAELQQTNSELLMLTAELDERIAQRTAELTRANEALLAQVAEVERAREEVRRTTERLELATRAAGLGVWEWDVPSDALVWDETTYRLYGVTRVQVSDAAAARRARLHPDDRGAADLSPSSPLLATPRFNIGFRVVWPDATEHVLDSSGLVVTDADGAPVRVVGMDQDITERVRAAEALDRYQARLEEQVSERTAQLRDATARANSANLAKSAFLANMSHELRTPMNAILGFADLLRTSDLDPVRRTEYLDIIFRSGSHLLALINDVLDMSKIESGRIDLDLQVVDVASLVRGVIELMRERASRKGLALTVDLGSDLPLAIRADEVKLRQILLNLLSNAIKATATGSVCVSATVMGTGVGTGAAQRPTVSVPREPSAAVLASPESSSAASPIPPLPAAVRRWDGSSHVLMLTVSDTGVGIDSAEVERVFEPFQQAGLSPGGTGLGLPISRRYAELMGGSLTVASEPGRGSVFRVTVPVVISREAAPPRGHDPREVIGLEPGQHVRVLIVEDQLENALLLRTLMDQAGIETAVAENGAIGVEQASSFRPDLIWMDWRMPVMDGLEATRAIRATDGGGDVVIVGVTASVFPEQRADLLAAGMNATLTKPFLPWEVYASMERELGIRFRRRDPAEPPAEAAVPTGGICAADLAGLPQPVLADLASALVLLEPTGIDRAIGQVAAVDPAIGASLRAVTDALEYEALLNALDDLGVAPA